MTDSSEIGRYGTLRLLKRHEPETTVAFFPIDDDAVTFGRSKQCSVRLYYDCVSELHCTLQISDERKAFLLVQGTNGVLVDGCQINASDSPGSRPTTVPLTNGTEIEIYKKRFKFEYPPKEIRAALLATPRHGKPRRSLRMSLIRSAQVLTPRSSPTNLPRTPRRGSIRDNVEWEALRSPVRVLGQENESQEIILIEGQGDDAVVVEEEKDLVILEQVENQLQGPNVRPLHLIPDYQSHGNQMKVAPSSLKQAPKPGRSVAFSIPTATPPPRSIAIPQSARAAQSVSQTPPVNRRRSVPSLHRAVVLRSAQRALEREREREQYEEKQEEDEVEAEVSPERELGPFELNGDQEEDDSQDDQEEDSDGHYPVVPSNAPPLTHGSRLGALRASLDAMKKALPLPFGWKAPEEVPLPEEERDEDSEDHDEEDYYLDGGTAQTHTPVRRNLGPFMTPQVWVNRPAQRIPVDVKARASIGGVHLPQNTLGGAKRVRVVPPWKVQDIVLPEPEKPHRAEGKQGNKNCVTEEERQAIMERRKSALQTPSDLPMPGPRGSAFPPPRQGDVYTPGEDSDEDAETMLEKMKQKMVSVRRKSKARKTRLSVAGPLHAQDFSLLAAGVPRSNRTSFEADIPSRTPGPTEHGRMGEDDFTAAALGNLDVRSRELDDLDILDDADDEMTQHIPAQVDSGSSRVSLTPRFDGVREMFRQPRLDPKTPSFTGFRKMFQERSEVLSKTPSFRGVKEMFSQHGPKSTLPTPQLNLGGMFLDENDESEDIGNNSQDEHQQTDSDGGSDDPTLLHDGHGLPLNANANRFIKTEVGDPVGNDSIPRTSARPKKSTASNKRPARKNAAAVNIPPAFGEGATNEKDEPENATPEIDPTPAAATRRTTKRSAKKATTPIADDVGENSGHGASRTTRKTATVTSGAVSKGIVVHKTTKVTRVMNMESDDDAPAKPDRVGSGKGKRVTRNQHTDEDEDEQQDMEAELQTTCKAKAVGSSDIEAIPLRKARKGRAGKTPQQQVDPDGTAPMPTRRVDAEISPESESLAPAAKPKSRRGAKAKEAEVGDEGENQLPSETNAELEKVTPMPNKGRVTKKGTARKTPASKENSSDDKENSGDQIKSSGKTAATRGRKTPVTASVEVLDAPAKRTRSRK